MSAPKLEFENGRLVKADGMRPEYMSGQQLLDLVRHLGAIYAAARSDALTAAATEYFLKHITEGEDERTGRKSAVRGMMVRLGIYEEFQQALEASRVKP